MQLQLKEIYVLNLKVSPAYIVVVHFRSYCSNRVLGLALLLLYFWFFYLEFGHVAAVNVPRRVLDTADPQRTVFAFVVMRTPEGARNAFNAARKVI